MSHLSFETIARLVDEQPSALDNAHLEQCATCRAELASMRSDIAALADLPDLDPSADAWTEIESRLEAEGLLRKNPTTSAKVLPFAVPFGSGSSRTASGSRSYVYLARAAAVAAIFLGGALVGRTVGMAESNDAATNVASNGSNGAGAVRNDAQVANVTPNAQTGDVTDPNATSVDAPNTGTTGLASASGTESQNPVRLASSGNANAGNAGSAQRNAPRLDDVSGDAALRSLRDAEDKYFSALGRYAEKAGTETNDPNARLAALEGIVLTTRAALAQAPTDPVINGYHLTALAQRDAMLKQIKANPAKSW